MNKRKLRILAMLTVMMLTITSFGLTANAAYVGTVLRQYHIMTTIVHGARTYSGTTNHQYMSLSVKNGYTYTESSKRVSTVAGPYANSTTTIDLATRTYYVY